MTRALPPRSPPLWGSADSDNLSFCWSRGDAETHPLKAQMADTRAGMKRSRLLMDQHAQYALEKLLRTLKLEVGS